MEDHVENIRQETRDFLNATAPLVGAAPARRRRRKRRPGGQPGNQNARKHGFYATRLTPDQQEALHRARESEYLAAEMALLRAKIRDLVHSPEANVDVILRAIWVLARTARIDDRLRFGV